MARTAAIGIQDFGTSGYLKVLGTVKNRRGKIEYELALTNKESVIVFDEMLTGV